MQIIFISYNPLIPLSKWLTFEVVSWSRYYEEDGRYIIRILDEKICLLLTWTCDRTKEIVFGFLNQEIYVRLKAFGLARVTEYPSNVAV